MASCARLPPACSAKLATCVPVSVRGEADHLHALIQGLPDSTGQTLPAEVSRGALQRPDDVGERLGRFEKEVAAYHDVRHVAILDPEVHHDELARRGLVLAMQV